LVISPTTAKIHVSRAITKRGARDRAELVIYAYEFGNSQFASNTDDVRPATPN
jgi:DNA-binding CsgD family transcriptional regulator